MSLAVYMDVHVPAAVTEGLRRKLLDVRTAQADAAGQLSDEELLARAAADDPTVTMREYKPQMVARFTINAVPALAVLDRGGPTDRDGVPSRSGIRFTRVRALSRQRRLAPSRSSFHSSTTAGRPHESLGKPNATVDSVRKAPARIILGNQRHALLFPYGSGITPSLARHDRRLAFIDQNCVGGNLRRNRDGFRLSTAETNISNRALWRNHADPRW